ncbi:MAG: pilin N-terminal domain-containing protein [Anaerococcus sp.]|nr:pilin N-terminal domain-containing protein [Anaerococcus sp.]
MKKILNKMTSLLVAFVMVLGILAMPFAALAASEPVEEETPAATATTEKTTSVTLHKMLLTKENAEKFGKDGKQEGLDKTKYDGTQIQNIEGYFGTGAKEIEGVYFVWQKLKNPLVVAGNEKDDKNWEYVTADGKVADSVEKALGGLTTTDGKVFDTSNLPAGKYRVQELKEKSTYKGEDGKTLTGMYAVPVYLTLPLVNDDGVVKEAHIYPKNTKDVPQIDKNFKNDTTGANDTEIKLDDNQRDKDTVNRKVGDVVEYQVETKIPKDADYKFLKWTDAMTDGLTYNKGSLKVTSKQIETLKSPADYTLEEDSRGYTVNFTDKGLKKVEDAAKNGEVTIRFEYAATLNGKAVVEVPETNDVALDYGHKPRTESEPKEGQPKNKEIKVEKSWESKTGDQTVTDADKTVTVVYTLYEKLDNGDLKEVESVAKKYNDKDAANSFNHTFTGLDDQKTYVVKERVSGYAPEYVSFQDGKVTIKNNKDNDNPKVLNPSEPKVVTYGKRFVKTDTADKRLVGAEFVVKSGNQYLALKAGDEVKAEAAKVTAAKEALDAAIDQYNKMSAQEQEGEIGTAKKTEINNLQKAYNEAFVNAGVQYTLVNTKDDTNVVKLVSDAEGKFEIKGLNAGKWSLEETKAPQGFAKLEGTIDFDVAEGSYAGTAEEFKYEVEVKDGETQHHGKKVENKKVVIPQTGGIGSVIFVVAGLLVMSLAAYKIKSNKQEAR